MNVKLYINKSEKNVLNKAITQIGEYNCKIKEDCTVTNPTIVIKDVADNNISRFNYMYIDIFDRYYFIDAPTLLNNGLIEITGKTDVLMSFKDEIKNCNGILDRQESIFNAYLPDDEFFNDNRKKIAYKKFGSSLPEPKLFLITV